MAGCAALWCKICYWVCLDTEDLIKEYSAACSELHDVSADGDAVAASAGGTALLQQAVAAPAPVQPVSVAQRYRDALLGPHFRTW